ncbi:hypothetical protein BDDG_12644 [Blastomyces dermatitidis ATCC 18188]|uniref:Uncharacterized protein n=1 Tax=Ajellomyces dermatitidis (strain ATCC 18188 / CBS 674.68) TaxID=653446 RepID=A0A0J9EQA5_AJEDA|nr:hypothetical protein BDDG_12644 [Blastomyces dermatitidis ATCC 18188]
MTDKTMFSVTIHLSISEDWKLWYKHILEYAKNKKVSDFINLDKPDIFSELEEPLEPECLEEATAEVKIVYDIQVTAWKIKYMKYEKLNEELVKDFKQQYRKIDILKEDKSMNFATLNERSQQSSSVTFRNCICEACH